MIQLTRTAIAVAAVTALQAAYAQGSAAELGTVVVEGSRDANSLHLEESSGAASRLGLSVRETPASVEILSQDAIQQRGARTFSEALRGMAGLSGGGPPSSPTTLSTRGFSSLMYLYDGVRSSGAGVVNRVQDTWNYDRIEVLKGPASVLDGEGAIGGVVNFVTKRPDRSNPNKEALLSYGSYGSTRAAFGFGGALGDASAYRIDYSRNDSKVGTIDRNGERIDHFTSGLLVDLGGSVKLDLSFDYLRDNNDAYWGTPLVPRSFATQPTNVVSTPDGRVIDRRMTRTNYNVLDDDNSSETYWLRARLTGQLDGGWSWRNEFSANKSNRVFRNSESATFVAPASIARDQTLITHDQDFWLDRIDATHKGTIGGMDNRFVVGGEYSETRFGSQRRFSNGSASTASLLRVPVFDPYVGFFNDNPALSVGGGNRTDMNTKVRVSSVFVEDALKPIRNLTLVGGLRHDRTEVDRSITDLNLGSNTRFGSSYRSTSGRLGAVYDITPQSSIYAQYTNATLPVNSLFLLSASNAAFPMSRGKQAEVGFKQSLPEANLEWTAAVYKIELDNVLSRDPANAANTVNNGRQSSRGLELSAVWKPTREWTLAGNLAALDARFDTLVEAGNVSRVGKTPPNVPERVANLFATYRPDNSKFEYFVSLNRTGHMFTDNANQIRINGFTTMDAAVSYRLKNALLSFRVRNLTDKLYATWVGRATSQVLLAPRRTFEVSAKFDF
ncbi:iron complex outermembrane receptor protein [Variovorax boronicumulans]|uniref:TonB-dependent receptor n=1 Tax=Variovorax boronicumulans TaxID=436515 RepID=UPI00278A1DC3|nr:TonB-dependent receptor [Variovorax boronicumulans]MDQ0017683.1 iron complex outermembrane receptor protein [Variovorax boronicumulans]